MQTGVEIPAQVTPSPNGPLKKPHEPADFGQFAQKSKGAPFRISALRARVWAFAQNRIRRERFSAAR
jgi:hypothetical protein